MTAEYHASGSLANLLAWRAIERPEFPFLYVEQLGPWTAAGLAAAAAELSTALERRGVGSGDRVLIRLGNDERFLPALTAVWLRGASAIAMHPAAPVGDAKRTIMDMGARVIVGDPDDPSSSLEGVPFLAVSSVAEHGNPRPLVVPDSSDDDEALVLLTSGSSGAPKGVVLTHGNAWSNLAATVSAFRRDTRIVPIPEDLKPPNLIANPLSHTAGVVRLLFALYVGRSVVLLRKFDPTAAKAAIDLHGIDNLTINPTMMRMLLEGLPPDADLGPVRYASSGTAPLSSALREAFEARFGIPVLQAYGQTEAFGGIAIENVKEVLAGRRRPGSVGRPLPGVQLRIVADGHDARPGEMGEIRVKTKSATRNYVGDAGTETPLDDDGWLRTGDLGHVDEDGYLYITGRLKSVIICGGFNVVPEELQSALMTLPGVREAAVLGMPDDRLGEIPVAVIESDVGGEEILASVAPMLAPYKRPRRIVVVDALPRVPNGKVDLRACAALVTDRG